MSVRILLHFTSNWLDIANITVPVLQEYADKWGYELIAQEVNPYDKYTGLHKIRQIKKYLKDGDVGFVIDCDAILTNMKIPIESFLDGKHDFYICEGLNAGVFIIKQGDWARYFIEYIEQGINNGKFHCEQDAIEAYLKDDPNKNYKIKVIPHPAFNSYLSELYSHVEQPVSIEQGQWEKGCFVCHVPSQGLFTRVKFLTELKEKIVR